MKKQGRASARNIGMLVCGVALVFGALIPVASPSGAATVQVVRNFTVGTWFGGNEGPGGSVGTAAPVNGPATPPSGSGSARLVVDSNGRASLGTNQYRGLRGDAIAQLGFWTYVTSPGISAVPVLQFDADYDLNDANTAFQGRLTALSPAVPQNTWTHIDALSALWFASGAPGNTLCTQATPCTWSQVLTAFPNVGVRNDSLAKGALILRLGGPVPGGATSYVDLVTVATLSSTTLTDFEAGASVTPSAGPAGTQVTIAAGTFKPGAVVRVTYPTLASKAKLNILVCHPRADTNGEITCPFTIPANSIAGVHTITIKGTKGGPKPNKAQTLTVDFVQTV